MTEQNKNLTVSSNLSPIQQFRITGLRKELWVNNDGRLNRAVNHIVIGYNNVSSKVIKFMI